MKTKPISGKISIYKYIKTKRKKNGDKIKKINCYGLNKSLMFAVLKVLTPAGRVYKPASNAGCRISSMFKPASNYKLKVHAVAKFL